MENNRSKKIECDRVPERASNVVLPLLHNFLFMAFFAIGEHARSQSVRDLQGAAQGEKNTLMDEINTFNALKDVTQTIAAAQKKDQRKRDVADPSASAALNVCSE